MLLIFAEKELMEQEQKYDLESVQELLSWAREVLNNKTYPAGAFQLNKSTKILDCERFLDSMISMISRNWENPTFHPVINQLREFREKIKNIS